MDLDLEILRTKGRTERAVEVTVLRTLEQHDLARLSEEKGSKPQPLTRRLGERHHALARNLASGMPDWEAAAITGYTPSHISILKNDPSFKELMEFYRDKFEKRYEDLHAHLAGMAVDVAVLLREQIETDPDSLSVGAKIKILEMAADRSGHGPSSNTNVNLNVGLAQRLDAARKRVTMIDVTPEKAA